MSTQACDQESRARDDARMQQSASNLGVSLLRVAWLAILLGLVMEVVLLLASGFGDVLGLKSLTAGLVKNVSWSVLVCAGLAIGTTLSRLRVPLMGFLGFLAAPFAFEVSRVLHKGTLEALSAEGAALTATSPLLLALVKGIEYGCLGLAIGWISGRSWGGVAAHAAVGLVLGMLFGSVILGLDYVSAPDAFSGAALLPKAINELLFPVGCSLVLFSAGAVGDRVAREDRP